MSEPVCLAFRDSNTGDRALNELRAMEKEHVLDLEDAVIVVCDQDGKVHLNQCVNVFGGCDHTWRDTVHVTRRVNEPVPALHESLGSPVDQYRWGAGAAR